MRKDKSVLAVIIVIVLMIVLTLGLTYLYIRDAQNQTVMKMGEIKFNMPGSDDEYHSVDVVFSVSGKYGVLTDVDKEKVRQLVKNYLVKGDFEKITGSGGMDYVKDIIFNALNEQLKKEGKEIISFDNKQDVIDGIYIDKIVTDFDIKPEKEENKGEDVAGMFRTK